MEGLHFIRRLTGYQRALLALFLLSLPLANPWVRGDGVGYYAYARALVVNGNLRFEPDWLHANSSFSANRVDDRGQILPEQYTATGHLNNHFSIGPALDWMPFLFVTNAAVLAIDHFGGKIPADGFSRPYLYTMALVTAFAGFLGLYFSFLIARKYFSGRWAFLATLGIWLASSLPVYMYFNPSWSHAHSAFAVALFIWYWDWTRGTRNWSQWAILGALGGFMMNVYHVNAIVALLPLFESVKGYTKALREGSRKAVSVLFGRNTAFAAALLAAFFPTLVVKKVIYGSFFQFGYTEHWYWKSPAILKVCFSSDHGLFSWTPILFLGAAGLLLLRKYDRELGVCLLAILAAFLYIIGCYENWHGISSYGSRFFISLTPIFVLGLAALFAEGERIWHGSRSAVVQACAVTALLTAWNAGLIFQWGMHLIPDRGNFPWHEMVYNQFYVVPGQMTSTVEQYFTNRGQMMQGIEKQDLRQLQQQAARQEKGGS